MKTIIIIALQVLVASMILLSIVMGGYIVPFTLPFPLLLKCLFSGLFGLAAAFGIHTFKLGMEAYQVAKANEGRE